MIKKYITDVNKKIYLKEAILRKTSKKSNNTIQILSNNEITNFYGFGSAITESSAYNYHFLRHELEYGKVA